MEDYPQPYPQAGAFLIPAEAAAYLDVKEQTLAVWRCTGRHDLPFLKIGKRVRYRKSDLDEWLAKRTMTVTPPAKSAA